MHLVTRGNQLSLGWIGVWRVLAELDKLNRIYPHGGCQTLDFVLAFSDK